MKKKISVVIPVYNEEKNVPLVVAEIDNVFSKLKYSYELILVNDGSRDASILEIDKASKKNKNVKGLNFSRNFGKEAATTAGCHFASGEAVITLDADLQHPPKLIPKLIEKWEDGVDVVYTVRKETENVSFLKDRSSRLYWWLLSKISSVNSEPHSTDFRLLDKKVLSEFQKFSERSRIFRGIIDWMGFKRSKVEFVAPDRQNGVASYSYGKLFELALNGLTAFSLLPLRLAGYLGVFITFSSCFLLVVMFITRWFFNPDLFTSLAFVVVANTILSGVILMSLGFIALYIARIHDEVVDRPLYIVDEKINFE